LQEQTGGDMPKAPDYRMPPGLGSAYCAALDLIKVKEAKAEEPTQAPAATPAPTPAHPPAQAKIDPIMLHRARSALQEARMRWEDARRDRNRYDVEIQKKFSLAASCLIFVLIGAPIALRFPRGGVGLVIGVSFAIFGVYYVGLIGGEALADKGYLPPWVAMWSVNIVLAGVGTVLAFRMGRESATTRGGDLGEWIAMVRAAVAERLPRRRLA